ncbi:hypothetical protein ACSCBZ_12035 [Streptomyces niveiscabiei]|uniref:Uncharacterized protein n=1 Tax=Streptomyces niveiscabiei TaxID=164115 RepID=A0ABW9I0E5_9ACTN|nr:MULTISPECIES: hypothetical protein [Streptomyces]QZZ31475.1 hypothetical protein A7X85_39360 [Streptomyces sp. ST1015]
MRFPAITLTVHRPDPATGVPKGQVANVRRKEVPDPPFDRAPVPAAA